MLLHDKLAGIRLILASHSPRRRQLIEGTGLSFTLADTYECEERYPATMPAGDVAAYLSELKSRAYPQPLADNEILVTADTTVVVGDRVLGKPADRDDATAMLRLMSGREHTVITGVTLRSARATRTFKSETSVRFRAMTDEEIALSQVEPTDSAAIAAIDTLSNQFLKRSNEMAQRLTGSWNWDLNATRIKYSGLLNPFQLGYSHRNGITYKQEFRISKTFPRDRQLRFNPDIGFVFKRKEIFVHLNALWEYLPERRGQLGLSLGNDNQTYSSKITNQIQEILKEHQATIDFDDLDLDYFHHYYAELRNSIELFNGFELDTRLTYHQRTPVRPKDNIIPPGGQLEDLAFSNYHDFVPSIGFIYTPRQYYRMDGHRKEYLYSYFPTFSLNVAKAIPGVLGSTGNYCRVEADMHQSINLGLSRRLNYHLSGGFYAQQKSTYFAEFYYFTRRNFPESWNDQIGGVFNLLSGEWFNASDKYMQAHLMYESPFVLFKFLARSPKYLQVASRYIITERFYLSQLWTPALPSYTEIGYGIGNNLFNIGFFAGFDRWKYDGFGLKFAFELFQ